MSDGFYRVFEDEHRGSIELIKSRQSVYLPFIKPLLELYPEPAALDLGCGRGEWLELLTETGFQARGVDLDDSMLAVCRERGLNVQTKDAIAGLKESADESLAIVSGFHLAEHLPFDVLQKLVSESLRILKPGGLLILETPNPENIVVGTSNFYLDPTHKQPIPPLLLSFLAEYAGFASVKVIRLQAPVDLAAGRKLTIHDVLGGVSPDYAIVAQKSASAEIVSAFRCAFTPEYGVTLEQIAGAYEQQKNIQLANLEAATAQALANHEVKTAQALTSANLAIESANLAIESANKAGEIAAQAMFKAEYAEKALSAIYISTSWRITAPIRWLGNQIKLLRERGVKGRFRDLVKKICKPFLLRIISYFDARPDLRARHSGVAGNQLFYDRIRALYLRIAPDSARQVSTESVDSPYVPTLIATKPTKTAKQIHQELKAAIECTEADK